MTRFGMMSVIGMTAVMAAGDAGAVRVGERVKLFKSVDENLAPVDMRALISGRPLVLVVGSAS